MHSSDPIVDGWQLDVAGHQITRGDVSRRIEPKAMQVLALLVARSGVVVSRVELLDMIWGGAFVGDDAVSAAVIKLRRAFDDSARSPRVIETVPKSGYRLNAAAVTSPASQQHSHVTPEPGNRRSTLKVVTLLRCAFRIDRADSLSMTPEEWQQSTDVVCGLIDDVVRHNGGETIQESGATLGVFGAPVAQEHHAMRAVQAAMEIRDGAMGSTASALEGFVCSWQIAVASGEILSGSAGARGGRTIHGAPLQRVISLGSAASPGEILLAGSTSELALGLLGVHRCETRPHAAGVNDFHHLDKDARWSSSWEGRAERGLTPLFGRDAELGLLDDLLGDAARGQGRILAISGEAGAGKSRLVHESMVLAARRGYDTFVAAASPLEARTPFFPLRNVLADRLDLTPRVLTSEAALRSHLNQTNIPDPLDVPALLAVLRPERLSDDWLAIDPDLRKSRSMRVLLDILIDDERPSLMVFEDLHWADEATLQLVDVMATQLARRPCIAMMTYRPDFIDPCAAKSYYTNLRLDALSASDSSKMIDHLAGVDPALGRWKAEVVDRAGGTPLFIEEVVRSARAVGTLAGEDGALKLSDPSSPSQVPASLHTLVADRIGRLSSGAAEILSLAAVVGRDVPASLLDSLTSGALSERSAEIDELQAAELLFGSRYQRRPGYVFKHALTQEVAYNEIPQSLRLAHHRQVADLLEIRRAGGVRVSPELLARHHSGAEQHDRATEAWIQAAEAATSASAFSDALDHLDQARSSLSRITAADRERLELSTELSTARALVQSVGPADSAVEHTYRRARQLADSSGTAHQKYEAAWGLWFVHLMRGEINVARQTGDELFELAFDLDDEALQLEAHHVQWSGLSLAGSPMAVRRHAQVGIEHYRPEKHHWLTFPYGGHDPGVCARNLDAMALWLLGEPDEARVRSLSALALAKELGHGYTQLESFNSALNIALLDSDAPTLLNHASALDALVADGTLPEIASSYANGFRANALVMGGDIKAGLELMRVDAPIWQEFWGAWCFPLDSALATTLALAGKTSEAIDHVVVRLELAEESGAHWWDAEFHRVLGELVWASDLSNISRAEGSFQRALDEARQQDSRFLELRAATSLARLYRDTSRIEDAVEQLNASCGRFAADTAMTDLGVARALRDELART
jgi:DNA-binding winged helix-turn-helix (wHTH) protein/predicted ATPase